MKPAVFILALLLNSSALFCQENKVDALDSFSGALVKRLRNTQGEKAYLTTDKTLYTTGEAIWFRAFLLQAIAEKISTKSSRLFVDLVDKADSVLARQVLNAREQQTTGRLLLPDTLATGTYWLRAYTPLIIQTSPKAAAVFPVYVFNPAESTPSRATAKDQVAGFGIDMFPEGGTLMTGISTTIGFYVHDEVGNPLSLPGVIKDNRDTTVALFTTNQFGLAKAEFFPAYFRKYKAMVSYNGKEYSFPLPAFNRFAGQLAVVAATDNSLKLRTVLEDSIYRKDALTYLIGLSHDSLCFASIGHGSYETEIPLANLPAGIATFLLFDKAFKLLSERKVYVKDQSILSASLDKAVYSKQSNATLSITASDKSGKAVPASLTVAVNDSSASADNYFLSAHALVRRIREKGVDNWDLLHLASLSREEADLLLLSSPSFYNNLPENKVTSANVDEDFFYIKGKLTGAKGEPVANQTLNLISKIGDGSLLSVTTDAAGRFSFPLTGYMDSTEFVLQAGGEKGRFESPKVTLDRLVFPRFQTPASLKQNLVLSTQLKTAYARRYADTTVMENRKGWLKQVSLNTKSKSPDEAPKKQRLSSSVLTSEQLLKLGNGNIGMGLLMMPGVQLIDGLIHIYGPNSLKVESNPEPIVLVDGSQIALSSGAGGSFSSPVIQYLNSLNPREIDYIELFKGPEASQYGMRGGNGVVYIHTASQVHQDIVATDGNTYKFLRQGYAKPADYPTINPKDSKATAIVDSRSTLYWNGNELLNPEGKSLFHFVTNDVPGRYTVVITGVTVRGELFYKTVSFVNQ